MRNRRRRPEGSHPLWEPTWHALNGMVSAGCRGPAGLLVPVGLAAPDMEGVGPIAISPVVGKGH